MTLRAIRYRAVSRGWAFRPYTLDQVVGADVLQAAGGRVLLASLVPGESTTGIVARMRQPAVPA